MKKIKGKNNKKGLEQAKIMGINVSVTSTSKVLTAVKQKISDNIKFSVVTPNPELVLMAQDNKQLQNALNSADFAVPDGVGLKLAIPDLNIIKGRQLFLRLIELASENIWRIFFLGGLDNEADLAASKLRIKNPNLKIETAKGPKLDENAEPVSKVDIKLQEDIVDKINRFKPQILFVAFGNPKQEIWIQKNLAKLKVGGAMAVGGTFRYVAGLSKLPPRWMEKLELEWAWRLINEPYRFKRIFQASVVFPLKLFIYKTANSSRAL